MFTRICPKILNFSCWHAEPSKRPKVDDVLKYSKEAGFQPICLNYGSVKNVVVVAKVEVTDDVNDGTIFFEFLAEWNLNVLAEPLK